MPSSLGKGGSPKRSSGARLMQFIKGTSLVLSPGAKFRTPVEAALPGTCTVGELCTNAADANKLYQCTTANTWTKVGTQA